MEKYCVSFELAKKMNELGFPQDTEFYWYDVDGQPKLLDKTDWQEIEFSKSYDKICAAPSVGEFRDWISYEENKYTVQRYAAGWFLFKLNQMSYDLIGGFGVMGNKTEADATAEALIYLAENKLIDVKDLI